RRGKLPAPRFRRNRFTRRSNPKIVSVFICSKIEIEMQEPGNRFPAHKERAAIARSGLAALWSSTAALRDEGRNSSPVRTGRSRPMETAVNAKLGSQVWYRTD